MTFSLMNAKDVPDRAEKSPAHIVFAAREKGREVQQQRDREFEQILYTIYSEALRIATTRPVSIIEAQIGQQIDLIEWPSIVWKDDFAALSYSQNSRVNLFVHRHAWRVYQRTNCGAASFNTVQRLTQHFSAVLGVQNG
ncbi:hypothetical protein [Tichowtungia aerotolerans]|uniref:Uncharacterized protein n=1 Tax=Tichowtungia aerotolerans TaxID=2697043 RepID=A0A6P1MD66_9BACT|nr:hypothetical protein [Tichowtungia aerotolerans]QHI69536.1 hypothetical protein GT409_08725 [Tichowtungia aerotolerans]